MAQDKLTQTQQQCLDYVKRHGGVLVRKPGGFWTTPDTPMHQHCGFSAPDWYVGVATVRCLERKGYLRRRNVYAEEWRDSRELCSTM